jgi:small subunit ribosomal protein S6
VKNFYEVVFIVRPDAMPGLVESIASDITKIIKDEGEDVTKTEFCGLRQFAYPIKKNKSGHYVLLNIFGNSTTIAEIDRKLRINENVLRHLVLKVDRLDNNPSPLMQNKHYRENLLSNSGEEEFSAKNIGE